jgi:hypothetical protein
MSPHPSRQDRSSPSGFGTPQSTGEASGVTERKKPPTWGGSAASRCGERDLVRQLKNTLQASGTQLQIDIRADWPIHPHGDGSFEWAELFDDEPAAHAMAVEDHRGSLVDCVAWYPDAPGRWWTLRGIAVVLGEDAVERADWFGEPITLYETPADWLKASACGDLQAVCILDWSFDPRLIFKPGMVVKPLTSNLAARLRDRHRQVTAPQYRIVE